MKNLEDAPELVRMGLMGIKSAWMAWFCVAVCVVIAIVGAGYLIQSGDWIWGGFAILWGVGAGAWYSYCLWWVAQNGGWD